MVLVAVSVLVGWGCSSTGRNVRAAREAYDIQELELVRTAESDRRPEWTKKTVIEDGKWLYFSGAHLGGPDYPHAIRRAHVEALKHLVQSISQLVTSEFSANIEESHRMGMSMIEQLVTDSLHTISEDIHVQGVRQWQVHYEEVFDPNRYDTEYNVWVQLQILKSDYYGAKDAVLWKLREDKRLSRGSRVVGSVVSINGSEVVVRVSELNAVAVVLDSAELVIQKQNRYASTISYFIAHVPEKSQERVSVSLAPVRVCGGSQEVRLSLRGVEKGVGDYLLGADVRRTLVLSGVDEVGGVVELQVNL